MSLFSDFHGCPHLQLAPMEGLGDLSFRGAMASVGGFDEAVREFLRVPSNAHVRSLAKVYDPKEMNPIPLVAQIMGSDPELMAAMARELVRLGAPRIDVNCGCPSNTVTGRGAGSSLLKDPKSLYAVVRAVVCAVEIPVTMKMRSGYEDTSLFEENLMAAQETGVKYITLHPRTKKDGYGPPAKWDLIAKAKTLLKIPLVGNGDILSVGDALKMLNETGCDGLMIGRGSIQNPFIFHLIRAHFSKEDFKPTGEDLVAFLNLFLKKLPICLPEKTKINKLKQLLSLIFKSNPILEEKRRHVLTCSKESPLQLLQEAEGFLCKDWEPISYRDCKGLSQTE